MIKISKNYRGGISFDATGDLHLVKGRYVLHIKDVDNSDIIGWNWIANCGINNKLKTLWWVLKWLYKN